MPYPIDELLSQLLTTLAKNLNVVLQAPPGAGKTTRVPLALLNAYWLGNKKIIMLEPRRIAARAAARFMASSINEAVGQTVGYRVRLDNKVSSNTRIEVVTEGILTRMLQHDPALEKYGVIIFDEFHERSLNSDLGLAFCLDAQAGLREDLRLIVMSATLDGAATATILGDAPILTSEGRSYPVDIYYRPIKTHFMRDRRRFMAEVSQQVLIALKEETGSALIFLPGVGEIQTLLKALQQSPLGDDVIIAPLYGQLPTAEQDKAIQPAPLGKRKIVLATSIAETSLTIEDIRIVIDCGLMRAPRFNPNTGLSQLVTLAVSKASSDQRSGRAGRVQKGVCYRLWSSNTSLLPHTNPEIADADLAPLMLELAQWGVTNTDMLRWIDKPPSPHVSQARELLEQLGAIHSNGQITPHGNAMAKWGMHPRLAHMIVRGHALGVGKLACEIAALLTERDILRGANSPSDLRIRLASIHAHRQAGDINQGALQQVKTTAKQWQRQLKGGSQHSKTDFTLAGVLLAYAYPDRISKSRDKTGSRFVLSNGRGARLNEGDALCTEEFIVAAHLDGVREARIFLAAAIYREQLLEYHHKLVTEHAFVSWDERNKCVLARMQLRVGEVVFSDEPLQDVDPNEIQNTLLEGIRKHGLDCLPWTKTSRELQARAVFLYQQFPNSGINYSDEALLKSLDTWLLPYLTGLSRLSHLQQLDLDAILLSSFSWEQQQKLDKLAPTHIIVPSGSSIRLDYSVFPPVLAVRLQEMFGLTETPSIANGNVRVLIHLLSPARRPLQITQDLGGFWQSSYHDVKKDMKGRYPKHHWPDNPLEAQATAKIKRKNKPG